MPQVKLRVERTGGKWRVAALDGETLKHLDTIDITSAFQRARFIKAVSQKMPGIDKDALERELLAVSERQGAEEPTADQQNQSAEPPIKVVMEYRPGTKGQRGCVTALLGSESVYLNNLMDPANPAHRKRILKELVERLPRLDVADAEQQLVNIATQALTQGDAGAGNHDEDSAHRKPSQADLLVGLAGDAELFHTPGGHDSQGFATATISSHQETWPISSNGFRRWLGKRFYDKYMKAPGGQAMQDALTVIAGKAIHDGPEYEVAVRISQRDGTIWLDLADKEWRAVAIDSHGWRIETCTPIKFVRRRGMLPLPEPVQGGDINELRRLVNLADDGAWVLFVAWLLAAIRPGRPFPILAVNGEQGSAKTTLCKMARALIDPNVAPLRRPPREDRDLMIAATNGWIVGFDNLSGIKPDLSDAICMLATGGGFGTRELYTDDEEKLFDAKRPVLLNGIEDLATRPDMLDRSINLTLSEINDDARLDEEELWLRFDKARPRILGALLNVTSAASRNRPGVKLKRKPRMADFATWIVAAEPALGWEPGTFMDAYALNRGAANALALEAAILTPPLMSILQDRGVWQGVLGELLKELEQKATEQIRRRKEWPTSPRKLSGDLRRLAPNLRRAGIEISFGKHTKAGTPVTLERVEERPSPSSPPSPPHPGMNETGDGTNGEPASRPSSAQHHPDRAGDEGDGGDGPLQPGSCCFEEETVEWTR